MVLGPSRWRADRRVVPACMEMLRSPLLADLSAAMPDEEEAAYPERADDHNKYHDGNGDDHGQVLLCSGFLIGRDQGSRRRRQLGLREDSRGCDGKCGAGGCAKMAVISEGFEDCGFHENQFTAYMRTTMEVKTERTVGQIRLGRRQIVAKLALIHHDICKCLRVAPVEEINTAGVGQVVAECWSHRRAGHNTWGRDVADMLWQPINARGESETKIVWSSHIRSVEI